MSALAKSRDLYRLEKTTPVAYDPSKLNVLRSPAERRPLVDLPDILPSQEKRWLYNYESHLLLPEELSQSP